MTEKRQTSKINFVIVAYTFAMYFDSIYLSWGFTVMNRHYDQGNSYVQLGLAYRFKGTSPLSRQEHGSVKSGNV